MMEGMKVTLLSAALAALMLPAAAQTSNSSQPAPQPPVKKRATIQQRKDYQQGRIAGGVKDGQLTAGEAANLERKEGELNQEERDMRKLDNGKLTAADRATLQQQQNQLSKQIYKDKHNAAEQNTSPKSEVGKRAENQQDRIAQGVGSGQLTAGEATHLEKQESELNQEQRDMRKLDHGKLTQADRAALNQQQNKLSKEIYKDKHNKRRQAK